MYTFKIRSRKKCVVVFFISVVKFNLNLHYPYQPKKNLIKLAENLTRINYSSGDQFSLVTRISITKRQFNSLSAPVEV